MHWHTRFAEDEDFPVRHEVEPIGSTRTSAQRCGLDTPGTSTAGFGASARFRLQSVIRVVRQKLLLVFQIGA
ncbi:MAG: hypothetical protein O2960_02635 [Verrucomicrobia bacterium]|nr:hypothetical protein [Verrucomicrobiota bacterium]